MLFCIIVLFLVAVCITGNSLVILVIYKVRALQGPSTRMLRTLAEFDLGFGLLILFDRANCFYQVSTDGNPWTKKAYFYLHCLLAAFALVVIAIERYLAVLKPFYHKVHVTKKWTCKAQLMVYGLSFVLITPGLYMAFTGQLNNDIVTNTSELNISGNYSNISHDVSHGLMLGYEIALVCSFTILPASLMSFLYGRIIYRVWLKPNTQGTNTAIVKARRKMTKLLLTITIMFYLCWLPILLDTLNYISDEVKRWFLLFPLLNTALNPIIYSLHSASFRKGVKSLCCACCVSNHIGADSKPEMKVQCTFKNIKNHSLDNDAQRNNDVVCLSVVDAKL